MKLIEGPEVSFEEWHAIARKQIQGIRAFRTLPLADLPSTSSQLRFLFLRRNLMNSPSGF